MNHRQRMLIELVELSTKIDRIRRYLDTETQSSDKKEQEKTNLLIRQVEGMSVYFDALQNRLMLELEN